MPELRLRIRKFISFLEPYTFCFFTEYIKIKIEPSIEIEMEDPKTIIELRESMDIMEKSIDLSKVRYLFSENDGSRLCYFGDKALLLFLICFEGPRFLLIVDLEKNGYIELRPFKDQGELLDVALKAIEDQSPEAIERLKELISKENLNKMEQNISNNVSEESRET